MHMSVKPWLSLSILLAACAPARNSQMLPGLEPPRWGTAEWHRFVGHLRDSLATADPSREAQAAIARGEYHLLGVLGEALSVPGLSTDWSKYQPGIYILPATGDVIEGDDHAAYLQVAHQYAEHYNRAVLAARSRSS